MMSSIGEYVPVSTSPDPYQAAMAGPQGAYWAYPPHLRHSAQAPMMGGLGAFSSNQALSGTGTALALLAMYVALYGTAGYYAGRAMAPIPASRRTYGTVGGVMGVMLGPIGTLGLGVMGAISQAGR